MKKKNGLISQDEIEFLEKTLGLEENEKIKNSDTQSISSLINFCENTDLAIFEKNDKKSKFEEKPTKSSNSMHSKFLEIKSEFKKVENPFFQKSTTNFQKLIKNKIAPGRRYNYFKKDNKNIEQFFKPVQKEKNANKKESKKKIKNPKSTYFEKEEKNNSNFIQKTIIPSNTKIIFQKKKGKLPELKFSKKIKNWYYINKSFYRKYQFDITISCIKKNTLVCLPTGLGKTFIAKNVIYNFHKFFPKGKIFFLAPTKPLVNQQFKSLQKIEKSLKTKIQEINGSIKKESRKIIYKENNIFITTPQTLNNDIIKKNLDIKKIILIVYDEAHRAIGKYAYTEINKILTKNKIVYRTLALSATPGNDVRKARKIVKNLNISHLEIRELENEEVMRYLKSKKVFKHVISESERIKRFRLFLENYMWKIVKFLKKNLREKNDVFFEPKRMVDVNYYTLIIYRNSYTKNLERYKKIYNSQKIFDLFECFNNLSHLGRMKSLLLNQGFKVYKSAMNTYEENMTSDLEKNYFKKTIEFIEWKNSVSEISFSNLEQHPKMIELFNLLTEFFNSPIVEKNQSKVLIFTQSRKNAHLIVEHLKTNLKIRSSIFIGQNTPKKKAESEIPFQNWPKKGLTQLQQKQIIQNFKKNKLNVLVATCVAEEGLDIGEIDLIICNDSGLTPTRLIQRMGRTGRKRAGKVVLLLTEKEKIKFCASERKYKKMIRDLKGMKPDDPGFGFFKGNRVFSGMELALEWVELGEERDVVGDGEVGGVIEGVIEKRRREILRGRFKVDKFRVGSSEKGFKKRR